MNHFGSGDISVRAIYMRWVGESAVVYFLAVWVLVCQGMPVLTGDVYVSG
jgi:hypothetical protein